MVILQKKHDILLYSVNTEFFDQFDEAGCSTGQAEHWERAASNIFVFIGIQTFSAKDRDNRESFIEYQGKLALTVQLEDDENDALQLEAILQDLYTSMLLFIENNSLSHYSKLHLPFTDFPEDLLQSKHQQLKARIAKLKNMKPFEDQSDIEQKLKEMIDNTNIDFKVDIVVKRVN